MLKRKYLSFFIICVLFISCDDKAQGYLDVIKPIYFNGAEGGFDLAPGKYLTELKVGLTKELTFTIYRKPKDFGVQFSRKQYTIPKGDNFEMKLSHKDIEQRYDMYVSLKTKNQYSDLRHKYYSCGKNLQVLEKVTYKNRMRTRRIKVIFKLPGKEEPQAIFVGEAVDDSEVTVKEVPCPKR